MRTQCIARLLAVFAIVGSPAAGQVKQDVTHADLDAVRHATLARVQGTLRESGTRTLLRAQRAELPPAPGSWKLVGRGGRDWEATLVLTLQGGTHYEGYFLWRATSGPPASGREPFEGELDPRTRLLVLRGREIVDGEGNICRADYRARVSAGGKHLEDGEWGGRNVIPGTWSATWVKPPATPVIAKVLVATRRLEALGAFYRDGLGLGEPARSEQQLGWTLGAVYFGLHEVDEAPPPSPGAVSFWFAVDELDATLARLVELGAEVKVGPRERVDGPRFASLADPDGNVVGLSERP